MEFNKRQSIIEKIQKLIDLQLSAERIGQKGEAFAAATAVHKLLTQYNLTLADIEKEKIEKCNNEYGIISSEKIPGFDEYGNWQMGLLTEIAKNNFCRSYASKTESLDDRYMWINGLGENVEVVMNLFQHIKSQFILRAQEAFVAEYEKVNSVPSLEIQTSYMKDYLLGCVQGLTEHLKSLKRDVQERFLCIRWEGKLNEYENKYMRVTKEYKYSLKSTYNEKVFAAGVIEGRNTRLYKEIK